MTTFYQIASGEHWRRAKEVYVTISANEDSIWYEKVDESNLCGYEKELEQVFTLIKCNSTLTGRFVQIQLRVKTILNLCEVEVWGW